jgi:hypothetical protein
VCPHVEWAISRVLSAPVRLEWTAQPLEPAARRAECTWSGRAGTGGELAAALRKWAMIRFEVTEEPGPGVDGERYMHVPGRGLFHASTSANGDIQLSEDRVRALVASANGHDALTHELDKALGTPWDLELEPFRHAGEGSPMTLLNRVG